eukprot:TRINITY_DN31351_c0_g1_i1.p1 TRINITY_DN31351_c0_g1~~TRINITY_DN31351_c0_g1_i1.p1  ORF type:complete len:578 (+),score=170.32 TRINITY_DN31351_c0_g1_i1:190-1923(+)
MLRYPSSGGSTSSASASAGAGAGAAAAAPARSGAASSSDDKKSSDSGFGGFDPKDLERGAEALREIDKSKNAGWAFDIATLQEKTAQIEHTKTCEEERLGLAQSMISMAGVAGEEQRKTISYMADQERNTAQYKAEIENSLQGRKLEFQREQLEYQLRRENEQFMQHEAIRIRNEQEFEEQVRDTMRRKAKFDQETAMASAKADAAGRAQQERENIEIRLRELRASSAEERRTRLESVEAVMSNFSNAAQALYEDPAKAAALVGGLTALALGVYTARAATRVASTVLERELGRPPLVRETSRWSWRPNAGWLFWRNKDAPGIFDKIVLEDELAERLKWTTNALISAQENGTPFRHLMLHGAPGTGKTLFARTLATQCGLDYAIMSGGDLGPLGKEGPHELHKLFNWASRSKRGMVLFVDEADAFLRRGRSSESGAMSEDARNALSVFLHHTGTENRHVAVILATNVPGMLDRAVIDRIDEAFEFPKPQYPQRLQMLNMFLERYVHCPTKRGWKIEVDPAIDEKFIESVAKQTEGMSGRQLAKLVLAFQSAVFGSGTQRLTLGLADTVLRWRLAHQEA